MPDKKFNIPDSLQPINKKIATPRSVGTIVRTKILDGVKRGIITPQVLRKYDFLTELPTIGNFLGNYVVDQLIIKRELDSYVGTMQSATNYIKLDAVTMVVTQSKNIVKTPIQGRNGTVKEYISDGDFDITIKGVIASEAINHAPEEDIDNLVGLMSIPNEIVLVSNYLALFKIQYVVVESWNVSQIEGCTNQVQIDIKLVSDEPVELKLGVDPNA